MIRFAALSRQNDYSNAGRMIANEYSNIQQAIANNKVNYSKIFETGMKTEAAKKKAAIDNAAAVMTAGIDASAKINDAKSSVRIAEIKNNAKRKAGKLAAINQLTQGLKSSSKMKRPLAPTNIDYESMIKEAQEKAAATRKQMEENIDKDNTTNNNSAGDDPGNTAPKGVEGTEANSVSTSELSPFERLTKVISYAEGTVGDKGFTTQFGGGQFTDLSKHPNNPVPTSWGTESEAAGKFQFMYPTWKRAASALGLTDFSPESQLKAGNWLAQQRGVDTTKAAESYDEFVGMIDKLAPEWAGLPYSPKGGSYYGQPSKDIKKLWEIYNQ